MRSALVLAALLLPIAARAQITLGSDSSSSTTTAQQIYIGRDLCKTKVIIFHWNVGAGHPTAAEEVDIIHARSSSTCGSTSVTSPDTDTAAASQAQTGTDAVKASALILDQSDAGLSGGCDNTDRGSSNPWTTHYCVQLRPTGSLGGTPVFGDVAVNFATANPKAPINLEIDSGDQHLKVNWTAGDTGDNIAFYDVHVLAPDAGLDLSKGPASHVSAATNADVTKTDDGAPLQNDVPYTVQVLATDLYGNNSDPSAPSTGTPRHVLDFYSIYRNEGGSAAGGHGCSSAGSFTWIAALALAAGLFARRSRASRKNKAGAALIAGLALLSPGARAEWRAPERPARKILVALKLDRYAPQVDSEAAFASLAPTDRPYYRIFHGRAPLRYQLELDWEVAHPFGSILVGVTAGYWQNFGKGLTADTRQPSNDTALLDVLPFAVVATYRFDWLADHFSRFPVIPYVQAGLMRALWASFNGTGSVSKDTDRGGHGSGWTYGYSTALGFALNLNAIDPELAREAYVDTGIQRTALFAEYGWTRLDNFHHTGALILSDRSWRFGVSLEF